MTRFWSLATPLYAAKTKRSWSTLDLGERVCMLVGDLLSHKILESLLVAGDSGETDTQAGLDLDIVGSCVEDSILHCQERNRQRLVG